MEIPCQYIFKGDVHKVKKSISVNEKAVKSTKEATSNGRIKDVKVEKEQDVKVKKEQDVKVEKEQDVKRIRLDTEGEEASSETNTEWVRIFNIVLKILDRYAIDWTGIKQDSLHLHLQKCFEEKCIHPFLSL